MLYVSLRDLAAIGIASLYSVKNATESTVFRWGRGKTFASHGKGLQFESPRGVFFLSLFQRHYLNLLFIYFFLATYFQIFNYFLLSLSFINSFFIYLFIHLFFILFICILLLFPEKRVWGNFPPR